MRSMHRSALAAVLAATLVAPAAAQQVQSVTQADIQRLQDNVYLADRDVTQMRSRDSARATELQTELDDLRDEVVYLKVKLRKERGLARNEYADVRDRIENVRTRARGESFVTTAPTSPGFGSSGSSATSTTGRSTTQTTTTTTTTRSGPTVEVPSGTEMDVRMQNTLSSGTAQVEDRFEATTLADITANGRVAIPAGSVVRGVVTAVEPGTRTNRTSRMTVSFDQVTISGRAYPMRGTVTEAIEGSGIRGEVGRTGAGAGVGAVLGGLLGGVKGAVLGAVIGAGGTMVATEGKEVELEQGTVLRVRIDAPLQVQTQSLR
jgi:TolA-binding protein